MRGYYFITDSGLSVAGNISDVKNAVSAGVEIVQYREKLKDTGELYREALILSGICSESSTRLIVNDRIDIALAVDADGVHLGQGDMPYDAARKILGRNKIIGVTVHNIDEALDAEKAGADYIGVSPVFSTSTKRDAGAPGGLELVAEIKRVCRLPLIAIGGIDLSNAPDVIKEGADMVCAISAVVARPDAAAEIRKFQSMFN